MIIAVTYDNKTGTVFQHFGHTEHFKLYTIENNEVVQSQVVDNGGFGHHDLATYLRDLGVKTLMLGNRGQGAIDALNAAGIEQIPGVSGDADKAIDAYLHGMLITRADCFCTHHHSHEH